MERGRERDREVEREEEQASGTHKDEGHAEDGHEDVRYPPRIASAS